MSQETYIFVPKYSEGTNTFHYLGSDGLPTKTTYTLYLNKCDEFKAKAKKYAKDNLYLKQSILHHNKNGYEQSDQLEEEVLLEREEHMKHYRKTFDATFFDEDPNSKYECFTGKSKRIRIIREFQEGRNDEFSDEFENKRATWFSRYCILSRFIQCARKIILINRLKKALVILKALTLKSIKEAQDEALHDEALKNEEVEKNKCQPCQTFQTFQTCQTDNVLFQKTK